MSEISWIPLRDGDQLQGCSVTVCNLIALLESLPDEALQAAYERVHKNGRDYWLLIEIDAEQKRRTK